MCPLLLSYTVDYEKGFPAGKSGSASKTLPKLNNYVYKSLGTACRGVVTIIIWITAVHFTFIVKGVFIRSPPSPLHTHALYLCAAVVLHGCVS